MRSTSPVRKANANDMCRCQVNFRLLGQLRLVCEGCLLSTNTQDYEDILDSFPGQATAYMLGNIKLLELRAKTAADLANEFDPVVLFQVCSYSLVIISLFICLSLLV
jgi:hypothetical protein